MTEWWHHIPESLEPIAFTVGFFAVHWYALCWLAGLGLALFVAVRLKHDAWGDISPEEMVDVLLVLFASAFVGGRVGYGLLYRPDIFFADPFGFFSPYHLSTGWTGIAGMSFHGGLMGVVVALFFFAKNSKFSFFFLADRVAIVAPLALFFGRIGNFLAGELYGRVTTLPWGMYVSGASGERVLRHPSALYEAFFEGIVLFLLLLVIKRRQQFAGEVAVWFLIGYGILRFCVEFVREPDAFDTLFLDVFTRGQIFSVALLVVGWVLLLWLGRKNHGKIRG